MKHRILICTLVLLTVSSMSGQMVSAHGSKNPPATTGDPNRYFAASVPSQAALAKPVARVNGTVLTDRDLVREEYAIFPYARQHSGIPKGMEPPLLGRRERRGAVEAVVDGGGEDEGKDHGGE